MRRTDMCRMLWNVQRRCTIWKSTETVLSGTMIGSLSCLRQGLGREGPGKPEFFYLEWMDSCLRQDFARMEELRPKMERLPAEIFLNASYVDSRISTGQWMELLREKTGKGSPVRLYYMIGETVSCLSGIRDLSDLFACGSRKREEYRQLWEERLTPDCRQFYELARQEYELQTAVEAENGKEWAK